MKSFRNSYLFTCIALSVVIFTLLATKDQFEQLITDVRRLPVVGQVTIQSGAQTVSSAENLPLVAFKPTEKEVKSVMAVKDDIFMNVVEEKKPVIRREIKKDYRKLLDDRISVQSVSRHGAIINGEYVSNGYKVPGIFITMDNGKPAPAVLVKADLDKALATISLDGKWYAIR